MSKLKAEEAGALLLAPAEQVTSLGLWLGPHVPPGAAPYGGSIAWTFGTGWRVVGRCQPTSRLGPGTQKPAVLVGGLSEGGLAAMDLLGH